MQITIELNDDSVSKFNKMFNEYNGRDPKQNEFVNWLQDEFKHRVDGDLDDIEYTFADVDYDY